MRRSRKPVKESSGSAKAQPKSYSVTRSGTRGTVNITEDHPSNDPEEPPVHFHQPINPMDVLTQQIEQEFAIDQLTSEPASSTAPKDPELDDLLREWEAQLQDSAEAYVRTAPSGKGQNEMLHDWMNGKSQDFLRESYMRYAPPDPEGCLCASPSTIRFCCDDCLAHSHFCGNCVADQHRFTPCHRISVWTRDTWSRTALGAHGLITELGRHRGTCVRSKPSKVLVGDITGFHELSITYCRCSIASEYYIQMLRGGIMPCSSDSPKSGFTLRALRTFSLYSADAKLSCSRYLAVLQRQTNNVEPHNHPNQLRELLRTAREWDQLQLLKRSGQVTTLPQNLGPLALRCPACPRLNVNYNAEDVTPGLEYLFAYLLSYDGSFQLVRKNKATNQFDLCMSDGLLYLVEQAGYRTHLEINKDTAYNQSTKGRGNCNNHRAANDAWVKQSGVAETGVGAVTCARHTLFMPQGCVNYWLGERYSYTDYAIAMVIYQLMLEGATRIGVFYDIFCHWHKNFWTRAPKIVLPEGTLQRPDVFFGGVPKYHLAGHVDSCYAQFSLNNMQGVGRLDAEGCERAWAFLNGASGSTSEKGPGSRIDSLNHCMNDWNWRKLVGMVTFLLKSYTNAVKMAEEQEDMWIGFHESLDKGLTDKWAGMSTEPTCRKGVWSSVFLLNSETVTSRLRKVLDLNMQESARLVDDDEVEPAYTAPTWLSEGLDIEHAQTRLCNDITSYGANISDRNSLDVYNRRLALSTRITAHRKNAAQFIDLTLTNVGLLPSLSEETEGRPEVAVLYMPSQLLGLKSGSNKQGGRSKKFRMPSVNDAKHSPVHLSLTERSSRVMQLEVEVRRSECYETLRRIRTVSIQKSQMITGKHKHARGEKPNTRAESMISRLTARVTQAMEEYNQSFWALQDLGVSTTDIKPFQPMSSNDLKGLHTILSGERAPGEGNKRLPWFWKVKDEDSSGDGNHQEEFAEAIRVEWFRGRERFQRWREEELWLRREMASTVIDYQHCSKSWEQLSHSEYASHNSGYRAYCLRQSDVFHGLMEAGFRRCKYALEASPQLSICERAITELSPHCNFSGQ